MVCLGVGEDQFEIFSSNTRGVHSAWQGLCYHIGPELPSFAFLLF